MKKKFLNLIARHVRCTEVTKMIKGWLVRERMKRVSGTKMERAVKSIVDPTPDPIKVDAVTALPRRLPHVIFTRELTFVTSGRITTLKLKALKDAEKFADVKTENKDDKKEQVTQERVCNVLSAMGARVTDKMPKGEGDFAKRPHVLLCDNVTKLNPDIKRAFTLKCPIIPFSYVQKCVMKKEAVPHAQFAVPIPHLEKILSRVAIRKRRSSTTEEGLRLKRRRQEKRKNQKKRQTNKPDKFIRNAAVYYSMKKRRVLLGGRKVSIEEHRNLLRKFMRQWKKMKGTHPIRVSTEEAYEQYMSNFILKYGAVPENRKVEWKNKVK